MKFFNLLALFVGLISTTLAAKENQITWYGCPRHCDSQRRSSCNVDTYPLKSNGEKYFCALSTKLKHYDDYCKKRAVVMLTDGSKKMINTLVVDSCSSCPRYHVDLSLTAFEALLPRKKGEADSIWAIFDNSGKKLAGPFYKSVSRAAEKMGMSERAFIDAFVVNGSRLVKERDNVGTFNKSIVRSTSVVVITKHVTKTTITPPKQTIIGVKTTVSGVKTTIPFGVKTTTQIAATTTTTIAVPPAVPSITEDNDDTQEVGGVDTSIGYYAVGGGVLLSAGLGLLFMKKKRPSTYEGMKNKFPEAFSQIKRGISRRATSLRRNDYV
ncbi:hypothetical protein BCR32DRAFT_328502 [Anaeromyces robustus]|jgi:hypothetical protein|uniref:RlpA-like protein double-psi beta-barrel domain-containing protein n=1 Tax=Anaeromyces robustus TaxID=1754192 RepID=A0A1Y1WYX0_9FUNG|nr:hypothetical protein BCR32DRAFT_328502 [Anaeromyces robustus]|eukprot:ORX78548.1 hypothetical protein BCR32DRAFT_328502 [Anaeromyces robustus]